MKRPPTSAVVIEEFQGFVFKLFLFSEEDQDSTYSDYILYKENTQFDFQK